MKSYRFVFGCIVITVFAISYVHQHIEIVKAGYEAQKVKRHLASLIDRNSKLMYNLSRLESPKNLLASLNSEEIVFTDHNVGDLANYELAHVSPAVSAVREGTVGKLLDLFTVNAEARSRKNNTDSTD